MQRARDRMTSCRTKLQPFRCATTCLRSCHPHVCVCGCALHVQLLVFSPEQRAAQPFGPAMDPAAYQLVTFLGPYIYR